ncbi:glycosyltransferase [Halospeciosus flavus]|uniref:glycosyltransferase n=1 Tax=Halospeciosus flavus TaxID=3032283 RepID=UPI003616FDFA
MKLIDYFARSLPVISTPFGVRGIAVEEDRHLCVAEIDDFPNAIKRLRDDPVRRENIGENARKLAADQYTWEAASRKVRDRIYELFGPF